jgi:hypothetical protein
MVRKFASANHGFLGGDDPVLDSRNADNHSEMTREAEHNKLDRMAKVYNFLKRWQGTQHLRAALKESRSQHMEMTAVG